MAFGIWERGSLDGWASAILSGIAILVGIALAWLALRQSGRIAANQAAMEEESYLSGRMQGLIEHARATVLEARTILDLASPRLAELLAFPPEDDSASERRSTIRDALTRLEVEVELLRVYAITMPGVGGSGTKASVALSELMDEGAWLYSDALHLAILTFDEDPEVVDLSEGQSIVDALMNGSFVNLPRRLLSDLVGKNPDDVPHYNDPGSPWPEVYRRREKILLETVVAKKSWRPDSLAEAGVWSLAHTVDRFQDALMRVLEEWDALRSPSPRSTSKR